MLYFISDGKTNQAYIQLISEEDGQESLIQTAKKLAHNVKCRELKKSDITPVYVDKYLQGMQYLAP